MTPDNTSLTGADPSTTDPGAAETPVVSVSAGMEVVKRDDLTPQEVDRVAAIKKTVDIDDPQAVIQFGLPAQSRIASFSDTLLADVRGKDTGYVGNALASLLVKARELDVDSLSAGSGLSKIPLLGQFLDAFNRFMARYQKLSVDIEQILDALERARMQLLKDVTVLQKMYELNLEYLHQLDVFILAGQELLEEWQTKTLPALEAQATVSKDPLDAQKLSDFNQAINRFERRLHDLKLSRMISIQTAPQLRLIQNNDQALVEKIQGSILNTIPLWKNQIVIAISLYRQQKALELQKQVTDTTNELLTKNAEMLKTSAGAIARESERGIVDIETLRKVNADLIATIEDTLKIQEEGRVKRHAAEQELGKLEQDLVQKLVAVRSEGSAQSLR